MTGTGTYSGAEAVDVEDEVRDVMVMTVPALGMDEQVSAVEPDEQMADDGQAATYVRWFIYDDTPRMEIEDEVRDLMVLAVPSLAYASDAVWESQAEIPDDGMEAAWLAESVPQFDVAEALGIDFGARYIAAASVPMIPAADVPMIAAPAAITETAEVPEQDLAESGEEPEANVPLVVFSFGPQNAPERGWRVCLSF
ncbi:MAG: hypothetical protein Q4Q58_03325 [Thermoplasmata archaeon]|nr:hypothetical protein [Thermoplasmata archaeon]